MTAHIITGYADFAELITRLEKHMTRKSCRYLIKFADIDMNAIDEIVRKSACVMRQ